VPDCLALPDSHMAKCHPTHPQPTSRVGACQVQVEGGTCQVEGALAKSQPLWAKKCESKCESQHDNCESQRDNCESMHDNCESDAQTRRDEL
jgi:hypothetical protein